MKFELGRLVLGRPRVGLALSSGGARGWAHIGVVEILQEHNIPIDVIAGTSAGAVVGAYYASGAFGAIREFADSYKSVRQTLSYMDFNVRGGGIIDGRRFIEQVGEHIPVRRFDELNIPFGLVVTDLVNMEEVHITEGALLPAVRAAVAIPGFMKPHKHLDLKLVDGGLLNPLPVSLCRKLGADIVIGVDLNTGLNPGELDTFGSVVNRSIETMMQRISRVNAHTDPADFLIQPRLPDFGFLDFHRADEAVRVGREEGALALSEVRRLVEGRVARGGRKVILKTPDFVNRVIRGLKLGAAEPSKETSDDVSA